MGSNRRDISHGLGSARRDPGIPNREDVETPKTANDRAEPTDEAMAATFAPCGLPAKPEWYPNIRAAVIRQRAEAAADTGGPVDPGFGTLYGRQPAYLTMGGDFVSMWRRGQTVRFYTATGQQIGPEHDNVFPAVVYAHENGWRDPAWAEAERSTP